MTIRDRIELSFFGTIFVLGLPGLILATRALAS